MILNALRAGPLNKPFCSEKYASFLRTLERTMSHCPINNFIILSKKSKYCCIIPPKRLKFKKYFKKYMLKYTISEDEFQVYLQICQQ